MGCIAPVVEPASGGELHQGGLFGRARMRSFISGTTISIIHSYLFPRTNPGESLFFLHSTSRLLIWNGRQRLQLRANLDQVPPPPP